MLKVNNVEIVYNDVIKVLKGISFEVPPESIVALLGSNGAGKSTVLKTISGIIELEDGELLAGSIEFADQRIDRFTPDKIVRHGIVQVPESRGIFDDLTVMENLRVGAYTRSDTSRIKRDLEIVLDYFPVLGGRLGTLAGYLSGGEQQMLAISRALMSRPKVLLLDEPSLGLAPIIVKQIFDIIKRINEDHKTTIFIVEQNANLALKAAHRGYVMETGAITITDTGENLLVNEDIKKAYLGI
jgi:branched-chain amino acid transport system ATP-binding protein